MREGEFKRALLEKAGLHPGHRVLDFGYGTGTLAVMMKRQVPEAVVRGVDIDGQVLALARKKIARAGLDVEVDRYDGSTLPDGDECFDHVVSSLVFHHLTGGQNHAVLREIHRVLRRHGEIHPGDFGRPGNPAMRIISLFLRLFEPIGENIEGLIPEYLADAGFSDIRKGVNLDTWLGTLTIYSAT